MSQSEISTLIERYVAGQASAHDAERLERIASANPEVARQIRAESAVRDSADLHLARLETARPDPSLPLMEMLRRTPPIISHAESPFPRTLLAFTTQWRALLLGTLLFGVAVGWSLVGTSVDDRNPLKSGLAPARAPVKPGHPALPPASPAISSMDRSSDSTAQVGPSGTSAAPQEPGRPANGRAIVRRPVPSMTRSKAEPVVDTSARPIVLPRAAIKTYVADSMNLRIEMKAER